MPITSIILENTSSTAQSSIPQTFGQVFAKGHLPTGSALELVALNGERIPCQVDVKNKHSDGSIKHAILSAIIPSLAPSASATYDIGIASSSPIGAAPVPSDFPGLSASVVVTDYGTESTGPNAGTTYTATLESQLAAGKYRTWLSGPICSEWIVRAPLLTVGNAEHPTLHVRFEVRVYKGQQKARIHCFVENSWIKPKAVASNNTPWESASNGPCIYSYTIRVGGVVVAERKLTGYLRARITGAISGAYNGQTTRIPNDSKLYTASVTINGIKKDISIAGSSIQNYQQLFAAINAQIAGAGTCDGGETSQEMRFKAPGTGSSSVINSIDYGTLLPALTGTGLQNNGTVYTATVTTGGTAYPISIAGNQAQTFAQLCGVIETQTSGAVKCMPQLASPGIKFTSAATGQSADVTLTEGTLFAIAKTKIFTPYRSIRGDEVIQQPYTRWVKTFWWGDEPAVHLRHDKAYLISTNAVPNYDPTVTGNPATIASVLNDLNNYSDIGQSGITKGDMPGPGASPGIGILPRWQAMYFVNQGKEAKQTMLRQAQLMGSWSVIHRDYDTDRPLSLEKWPYATLSQNGNDSRNPATGMNEKIPAPFGHLHLPNNPNKADVAHHPDFNFLPYLVTGDHCYLEGMELYFTFTCLNMNAHANYRDGRKCLLRAESQTRGKAWFVRTACHTAYLSPDGSSKKQEAEYVLEQNCEWLINEYAKPGAPKNSYFGLLGEIIYPYGGQANVAKASFQEDFATQSFGRAAELGFTAFLPLLEYKARHIRGRLLSGADFCWQYSTNYELRFKDTSASPEYTSWKQVYENTAPANVKAALCGSVEMGQALGYPQNSFTGRPNGPEGYPANMQPAVAYCATFDVEQGGDAWLVHSSSTVKPAYNDGPQFAIVPRATISSEVPEIPPTQNTIIMAIADRVKDSTTTTGTGSIALSGTPPLNHRPFLSAPIVVGDRVPYAITHRTLNEWENGWGTLVNALTLSRDEVTASSNNDQLVAFSAGTKDVSCDLTAAFVNELAGKHNATVEVLSTTPDKTLLLMEVDGQLQKIALPDLGMTFAQLPLLPGSSILATDELLVSRGGIDYRAPRSYLGSSTPTDTTAPTLSGATGAANGSTAGTASVTTNESNGTLYCLHSTSNTATAAAVKAGQSQAVTSTGAKSFSLTGLTASTTYYAHFLQVDAAGNETAVLSSVSFTTSAVADTTAPTLSSPAGTQTGSTTATATVSTNEANGTIYCLLSTSSTATAAQVKAGLSQAVSATGTKTFNGTGLTAGTAYFAHFLHTDAAGNDSAVVSSASFTTAAAVTAYTITGYSGNAVKSAVNLSTVNPASNGFKGSNGGGGGVQNHFTNNAYWDISPAPASAKSGWGDSPTVPPSDITGTQSNNGSNGFLAMGHPAAWVDNSTCWNPATGGPFKRYFWIWPAGGNPQCMNPSGMDVTV